MKRILRFLSDYRIILIGLIVLILLGLTLRDFLAGTKVSRNIAGSFTRHLATFSAQVGSPFLYTFKTNGILEEAGAMEESSSPYFWLNSGGRLIIEGGTGKTVQEALPSLQRWRVAYALANPVDTDQGFHPQNLFRLITRSQWKDAREEFVFSIVRDQLSESPNRNASNGVLLMMRYVDSDNLYYAGLRVDGAAVIKKKYKGTYYTLATAPRFGTNYDRVSRPNLLPKNRWMGLRAEVRTLSDGSVALSLYSDENLDGSWDLLLTAHDTGDKTGGEPIRTGGYAGIRTDFMDVEFDNFRLTTL
jgi:hypothetical protein